MDWISRYPANHSYNRAHWRRREVAESGRQTMLRTGLALRSSSPATGVIWAQSPKKVRKWVPGPLGPGGRKSRKRVEKEPKIDYFSTFWTLFRLFDPRGREVPGTHFRTFFGLWARRAQMTPVAGEEDRKPCKLKGISKPYFHVCDKMAWRTI